jgi:sulfide:quinone oxidoreductase
MAEAQGMRVAAAIAAEVRGDPPPPPYGGHGACFLELGSGEAAMLRGDFFAEAGPEVRILDSSPQHAEEKRRFERERLAEWFA